MAIHPVRLEELIEQLIETDPRDWDCSCKASGCDPETVALARRRAKAFCKAPPDIPVGKELEGRSCSGFDFVRLLGKGGFGEVWLAFDQNFHRWVALKFLHSRDQEHRQRLFEEARSSAKLSHPHIVTVHTVVDIPELKKAAIVMELCWESSNSTGPLQITNWPNHCPPYGRTDTFPFAKSHIKRGRSQWQLPRLIGWMSSMAT